MKQINISEPRYSFLEALSCARVAIKGNFSHDARTHKECINHLASIFDMDYTFLLSNGTQALISVFQFIKEKYGPETRVAIPDITFGATVNAAILTGLKVVLVDVSSETGLMDEELCIELIKDKKVDVICLVQLNGRLTTYDFLKKAHSLGALIIEDAAESLLSTYGNGIRSKYIFASITSFYGNKFVTSGEGGALATSSQDLRDFIALFINHGMSLEKRYRHQVVGSNCRMNAAQTAILSVQLKRLDSIKKKRILLNKEYDELVENSGMYEILKYNDNETPWLKEICCNNWNARVLERLQYYKIDTRPMFFPMSNQAAFKGRVMTYVNNGSSSFSKKTRFFPLHHNLKIKDVRYIMNVLFK